MSLQIPKYKQKASRMEFCCVRFLYMIPLAIIGGLSMVIAGIIMGLLIFFNFFTVLFGGSYLESAYKLYTDLLEWSAQVGVYMVGLSNERPPLSPFF